MSLPVTLVQGAYIVAGLSFILASQACPGTRPRGQETASASSA